MENTPPRVFLSYSHESKSHADRVLRLANELRANGVDAWLDQYELAPAMGWPRWMQQQIDAADFVLVVASPTYKKRFEGKDSPGTGRGVSWEGLILNQALYEASGSNKKIIPVIFDGDDPEASIPAPLRPFMFARLPEDFEVLLRQIYRKPAVVAPAIGRVPELPPRSVGSSGSGTLPTKAELRLDVDVADAKARVKDIEKTLREALGSDEIYITAIKEGSARLQISGDDAAIAKLKKLISEGRLSELLGLRVDNVRSISDSEQTKGPPWLDKELIIRVYKAAESLDLLNSDIRIKARSIYTYVPPDEGIAVASSDLERAAGKMQIAANK